MTEASVSEAGLTASSFGCCGFAKERVHSLKLVAGLVAASCEESCTSAVGFLSDMLASYSYVKFCNRGQHMDSIYKQQTDIRENEARRRRFSDVATKLELIRVCLLRVEKACADKHSCTESLEED